MLRKTSMFAAAMAAALLSLPAAAGSWPNLPASKAKPQATVKQAAPATQVQKGAFAGSVNGFEYVGGDAIWQLSQHKYVWSGGGFAHTDECDHAVRTVRGPTLDEIDSVRKAYPGA